jgi:flagellar protein FlbD
MVELTRLHGQKIIINAELIEFIEETPDTLVVTTTGKKVMVQETISEIVQKVTEYRQRCLLNPQIMTKKEENIVEISPPVE